LTEKELSRDSTARLASAPELPLDFFMFPPSPPHPICIARDAPKPPANGEVVELSLLLSQSQVRALELAARQRRLTTGEMVRRVLEEFLRQAGPAATARQC
jgi:hypothetical protein